jgi:hypothetical protein
LLPGDQEVAFVPLGVPLVAGDAAQLPHTATRQRRRRLHHGNLCDPPQRIAADGLESLDMPRTVSSANERHHQRRRHLFSAWNMQ